ncbi:MAG: 1-acyl-sn-glycerol-3-phosphate acyltransferase [Lewinellaceae bacterium]|nr:1-acyl-sn-glycerol-3-phosphate acyltransferase [Phaeodactylibacter sp.]MCB0616297.1 1-acyl-sn-glycerol-3-phosphate acyltransferase [Phaeodactylibacter sp.]MCB9349129.1 1-acyl-sn-glycerol-3-phosphate acyltransferase [Lewinellaceae bacterium]
MLYPIVRPIARLGLKAFYRKIYLSHVERIPQKEAVILAANHPTAFLEPCILACFLGQPLYFLARGDLFEKPFYAKLLRGLNILPVFRLKDGGYGKLKDNYSTFEACYEALAKRKTIMILAEGRTKQEKRLGGLQKGTARIALGTLERYPNGLEEVYIVPVGVNFTYADQPRSEVMIDFGEPILASHFLQEFKANSNQGMATLTDTLRDKLEQCMVIIDHPEDEQLVEYLHRIYRNERAVSELPVVAYHGGPLESEKEVSATVNRLPEKEKQVLRRQAEDYFMELRRHGVNDQAVVRGQQNIFLARIALILGFPLFLLGLLWNYPPTWLAKYISDTQVATLEFKAPVRWAANLGTYLTYLLGWILLAAFSGAWILIPIIVSLLLMGYFALYYSEFYGRYRSSMKASRLSPQVKAGLLNKRTALIQAFKKMAASYV